MPPFWESTVVSHRVHGRLKVFVALRCCPQADPRTFVITHGEKLGMTVGAGVGMTVGAGVGMTVGAGVGMTVVASPEHWHDCISARSALSSSASMWI
jgi:hypothetical protein